MWSRDSGLGWQWPLISGLLVMALAVSALGNGATLAGALRQRQHPRHRPLALVLLSQAAVGLCSSLVAAVPLAVLRQLPPPLEVTLCLLQAAPALAGAALLALLRWWRHCRPAAQLSPALTAAPLLLTWVLAGGGTGAAVLTGQPTEPVLTLAPLLLATYAAALACTVASAAAVWHRMVRPPQRSHPGITLHLPTPPGSATSNPRASREGPGVCHSTSELGVHRARPNISVSEPEHTLSVNGADTRLVLSVNSSIDAHASVATSVTVTEGPQATPEAPVTDYSINVTVSKADVLVGGSQFRAEEVSSLPADILRSVRPRGHRGESSNTIRRRSRRPKPVSTSATLPLHDSPSIIPPSSESPSPPGLGPRPVRYSSTPGLAEPEADSVFSTGSPHRVIKLQAHRFGKGASSDVTSQGPESHQVATFPEFPLLTTMPMDTGGNLTGTCKLYGEKLGPESTVKDTGTLWRECRAAGDAPSTQEVRRRYRRVRRRRRRSRSRSSSQRGVATSVCVLAPHRSPTRGMCSGSSRTGTDNSPSSADRSSSTDESATAQARLRRMTVPTPRQPRRTADQCRRVRAASEGGDNNSEVLPTPSPTASLSTSPRAISRSCDAVDTVGLQSVEPAARPGGLRPAAAYLPADDTVSVVTLRRPSDVLSLSPAAPTTEGYLGDQSAPASAVATPRRPRLPLSRRSRNQRRIHVTPHSPLSPQPPRRMRRKHPANGSRRRAGAGAAVQSAPSVTHGRRVVARAGLALLLLFCLVHGAPAALLVAILARPEHSRHLSLAYTVSVLASSAVAAPLYACTRPSAKAGTRWAALSR